MIKGPSGPDVESPHQPSYQKSLNGLLADLFRNTLNNPKHHRLPPPETTPHLVIGGHRNHDTSIDFGRYHSEQEAASSGHHRNLLQTGRCRSSEEAPYNVRRQTKLTARPATCHRWRNAARTHAKHQNLKGDDPRGAISDRRATAKTRNRQKGISTTNRHHPT